MYSNMVRCQFAIQRSIVYKIFCHGIRILSCHEVVLSDILISKPVLYKNIVLFLFYFIFYLNYCNFNLIIKKHYYHSDSESTPPSRRRSVKPPNNADNIGDVMELYEQRKSNETVKHQSRVEETKEKINARRRSRNSGCPSPGEAKV